ncbi:glycoside hydrolase family 127 protein [Microbacterium sp. ZW T5_56]|uniref:glycoside hydrolase family 127 protein n=1 Tax=Microbacterium sp. ZW T5_56 TaxID=3378081 RepID=UPI003851A438
MTTPESRDDVVAPVVPARSAVRPLGLDAVRLAGGFWGEWESLARDAIIPHAEYWEERTGWLANFDAVAAGTIATRAGREFSDSEIYKLLEAMAWQLGRKPDAGLESRFAAIVARVSAAQQPDGYLSTMFGNPGQAPRWSQLDWGHELYCLGHLFQAAVARVRSGYRDELVTVATRAADHVCDVFAPGANPGICGHPEVEVGLAELGRALGERRYLDQAREFIERRGHHVLPDIEFGREYFQDDIPVRDAPVLRGHAVRALYLSSGALDVADEFADEELADAVRRAYDRTLERRTYVTGGMGSHHQDEAFGEDFELPADRAYCETCAGIGSVMTAWRLLLGTGDLRYGDIIERTMYNVVAVSPRADGRAFFYTNPLQQRVASQSVDADDISRRARAQLRAPWFEVSCCPTNVARTLSQFAAYVAVADQRGVSIVQYADADIRALLPRGAVLLRVRTDYPHNGRVSITVVESPTEAELRLRLPSWATGATVQRRGERSPVSAEALRDGVLELSALAVGEEIVLELPLAPRLTHPDPRIDAVRGSVAVELGPLVLCAESVDVDGADVADLVIDATAPLTSDASGVRARGWLRRAAPEGWPYRDDVDASGEAVEIPLVPYYSWAQRGPSTMRIWIPTS